MLGEKAKKINIKGRNIRKVDGFDDVVTFTVTEDGDYQWMCPDDREWQLVDTTKLEYVAKGQSAPTRPINLREGIIYDLAMKMPERYKALKSASKKYDSDLQRIGYLLANVWPESMHVSELVTLSQIPSGRVKVICQALVEQGVLVRDHRNALVSYMLAKEPDAKTRANLEPRLNWMPRSGQTLHSGRIDVKLALEFVFGNLPLDLTEQEIPKLEVMSAMWKSETDTTKNKNPYDILIDRIQRHGAITVFWK